MRKLFLAVVTMALAALVMVCSISLTVCGSIAMLWMVDALCGTSFFQWDNVAILSLVMYVVNYMRGEGEKKA